MTQIELPYLTEGYLGKQAKFDAYGLTTVSHPDPVVMMDTDRVEIIVGAPPKTRMTSKFISMERKKEMNEYHLVMKAGLNFCYLVRPPTAGFYKLQLYALPPDEAGPQMQGVVNYLIHCPGLAAGVQPFPKVYPLWKEGCYLYEPISLPKGIRDVGVKFRYFIPKARDVQVKVDNDWNKLEAVEPDVYEGFVDFSQGYPSGTKVKLNVKSGGNKFDTLMEYTIWFL